MTMLVPPARLPQLWPPTCRTAAWSLLLFQISIPVYTACVVGVVWYWYATH